MLEVLRELVDAVESLRGITGNRRAELHAKLDQAAGLLDGTAEAVEPADVPPGA